MQAQTNFFCYKSCTFQKFVVILHPLFPKMGPPMNANEVHSVGKAEAQVARPFSGAVWTLQACCRTRLDRHDFFFFSSIEGFHFSHVLVVNFLDILFRILLDILAQTVLDEFLKLLNGIAAGITDGHLRVL